MTSIKNNNQVSWNFAALQFFSFAALSLFGTYGMVYFQRRGLSKIQIGILNSIVSAVSIFSPMIWGITSDWLQKRKPLVVVMNLVSALLFPLFWFLDSRSFILLCSIRAIFSFFFRTSVPLIDAWTLDHLSREGGDYGKIRSWGSIGYMIPLVASIFIFSSSSEGQAEVLLPMFFGVSLFRIISAIQAIFLPDYSIEKREEINWRALNIYLHPFALVFFFSVFIRTFIFAPYFAFFNIYLDQLGVADNMKGLPWIFAVGAEVVMIAFSGSLIRRFGAVSGIILAFIAMSIRLFVLSATPSWEMILFVQLLHGFTFGAYHPASIQIINKITPDFFRATGQTLVSVVGASGGILGSLAGAVWAEANGYTILFRNLGLCALFATILMLVSFSVWKE